MIAQLPNLDTILEHHEIPPKFWAEIRAFVEEGTPPSGEMATCLRYMPSDKASLKDILSELSKGLEHKFPPPDYQSPVPYESLLAKGIKPEAAVPVTSAGAPSAAR